MKTKLFYLVCLSFLIFSTAIAQPKPKPKKPSKTGIVGAKGLHQILSNIQKTDKIIGKDAFACDALPYLKAIPDKKKIPRIYEAARAIDILRSKLLLQLPPPFDKRRFPDLFDHFARTDNHLDFVNSLFKDHKDISPIKYRDQTRAIYNALLPLKDGTYTLYTDTYKNKGCDYKITTRLKYDPDRSFYKTKFGSKKVKIIAWDVHSTITMTCSCVGKNKNDVKSAVYDFSGKAYSHLGVTPTSIGFIPFSVHPPIDDQEQYVLTIKDVVCCPEYEPKTEDGSFIDPNENEDISFPNQFIEVGAGIGTAKDEETELCALFGFMHNLFSEEENDALFIGARAKVNNASFSGSDFSQTTINVGPAVEHQSFFGDTETKWINGINGAFVFGSQDSAGFKTDISGFNIGLYTGVEVALGNQIALGVMATLVEYNNQTFKTDDSEIKTNNTGFNLNKGSVGLSLRIDLDSN